MRQKHEMPNREDVDRIAALGGFCEHDGVDDRVYAVRCTMTKRGDALAQELIGVRTKAGEVEASLRGAQARVSELENSLRAAETDRDALRQSVASLNAQIEGARAGQLDAVLPAFEEPLGDDVGNAVRSFSGVQELAVEGAGDCGLLDHSA